MQRITRRASVGLALLAVPFSTNIAHAQSGLDPIVVTASRFPEHRLDAPIGTRVITADEISDSTAHTVPDVLSKLGGVHVRDSSGSPDVQLDLRGFGITGDDNTLVLLDGVRIDLLELSPRGLSGIPLNMVDRIEILPGGGAVQYGAGATGGTINIITKSPAKNERSGALYAGAGGLHTNEYRATAALRGDAFGATFGVQRFMSDNYRENNRFEQDSAMGALLWSEDASRVALRFGASEQFANFPGARTEAQLKSDRRGTDTPDDHGQKRNSFATLSGGVTLQGVDLDADLSYKEGERSSVNVFFGSPTEYATEYRSLSVAPRARWNTSMFGMPTQWIVGGDYYDWEWQSRITPAFPGISDGLVEQRSKAFYVHNRTELTRSTRLDVGVRAQRTETQHGDATDTRSLYANEFGLRQKLGEHWTAHGKLSRSYRLANADENALTPTGDLLRPQTARTKEVGIEYRRAGVRASVNAFDIKLKNEIAYIPFIAGFGANTNLSPTRRRGIETVLGWQPTRDWDFSVIHTVTSARFREGVYDGVDVSGNEVPLVPRHRTSVNAVWEFHKDAKLGINYTYVGRQRYDGDQANLYSHRMPSYEIVDLRLAYTYKGWTLAGNLLNALNERYYSYGTIDFCASFCAYPQAGRTFFASAEYRFR